MPWQRLVAEVGGEVDANGVPAYRQVVLTVPRQNGKTTLILSWELQRAIGWEHLGPQRIVYGAQTGSDARKKFLTDQVDILELNKGLLGITAISKGMGNESVVFANRSRLSLMANTEAAGHGQVIDLAVKDELFADYDDRRDQALIPAMATRRYAQILAVSTMGTEESVVLNALVDKGRASVEAGKTDGLAYFEWSAPEDDDPDDPDTWWRCMPALGHTIDESVVRNAREITTDNGFRRAWLNQRTKSDDRVIPQSLWDAVCDPNVSPAGRLVFAVDVADQGAAVVACSAGSKPVLEVVEPRLPVGRLVGRCTDLNRNHSGAAWVIDSQGPASRFAADLERAGLRVVTYGPRQVIDACGSFVDAVLDEGVRIRSHWALDEAVAAAAKRAVGDAWAWTRKNSNGNIAPLVAATLARAEAASDVDVSTQVW